MQKRQFTVVFLVIVVFAFLLRGFWLDARVMHGDEANQAQRFGILLENGEYIYDPHDYHGPTLYYLALPMAWMSGADSLAEVEEWHLRGLTVLFGVLAVGLLYFLRDGLGDHATLAAGVLGACSPAMVYYSRYFIQEPLFVVFTGIAIVGGWRYYCDPSRRWAVVCGLGLGLMHATKETCILPWAAAGAGIAGVWYWRCRELGTKPVRNPAISSRHAGAAVGAAVLISALFFSSFLTNPKGPVEAITGYTSHIHRGLGGETDDVDYTDGKAHVKPPTYFAAQLVGRWEPRQWGKPFLRNNPVRPFTELLLVILFTVGAVRIAREKGSEPGAEFRRFILIYSLVLFAFYSGIPYKTPWCAIGFMHGVIMVAGVGFAAVLDLNNKHLRTVAIVLVVMGAIDLVRQDVVLNGAVSSDTSRNPFAYVHAVPDSRRAAERVVEAAASHPQGNNLKVGVVVPDPWPLPWYLRTLNKVGYWEAPPDIPVDQMPVLILSAEFADLIASIEDTHQVDMRGLRPAEHVIVAIRKDVWEAMGK